MRHTFFFLFTAFLLTGCTATQEIAQNFVDDVRKGTRFGFEKEKSEHLWIADGRPDNNVEGLAAYSSTNNVRVYDPREHEKVYELPVNDTYDYDARPEVIEAQSMMINDPSVTVYSLDSAATPRYQANVTPPSAPMIDQTPSRVEYQATYHYDSQPVSPMPTMYEEVPIQPVYTQESYVAPEVYYQPSPYNTAPSSGSPAKIYYNHGATRLDGSGKQVINNVANSYNAAPTPLRIEGYASVRAQTNDPVKREILNLKTSMDRAINVSQELIKKGVPANYIRTIAYGDTKPASPSGGVSVEDASRRVEIYGDFR
jgi:outer membrane protein OmpA-like peptidoglycan-associated protein